MLRTHSEIAIRHHRYFSLSLKHYTSALLMLYLVRWFQLSWRPAKQEVNDGAVWNDFTERWTGHDVLVGLEEERSEGSQQTIGLAQVADLATERRHGKLHLREVGR